MKKLLTALLLTIFLMSGIWSVVNATTRYVSKTGSDGYTGASWAQAWQTINKVNTSTVGGDTVVFATGIWREELVPKAGSSGDRTCYIDSMFYAVGTDTLHYPTRRVAWIFGADSLSGWSLVSGNIYSCSYTAGADYSFPSLFQGNNVMWGKSSSSLTAAGQFYYNSSAHTITAWAYGGGNPNQYDIEATDRGGIAHAVGGNYVAVIGLGFKYGDGRIVASGSSSARNEVSDFTMSHCYLANSAGWFGINPSLIYTGKIEPDTYHNDRWRIVACSLGSVYAWTGTGDNPTWPQTELPSEGNCVTWYSNWYGKIDSNVTFGHQSEAGFYLKCNLSVSYTQQANNYDTICYNFLKLDSIPKAGLDYDIAMTLYGIRIFGDSRHTRVFGNAVQYANNGVLIDYSTYQSPAAIPGDNIVSNNTFYECAHALREGDQEGTTGKTNTGNVFKYNVIYNSALTTNSPLAVNQIQIASNAEFTQIDSNKYFDAASTSASIYNSQSWATWTATWDNHSSTNNVNPGFTDGTHGNFARPSASGEMNSTYGGRTWTKYGAVQDVIPLDTNIVIGDASTTEGGNLTFTVTLSLDLAAATTYTINTVGGSATSGVDYTPISGATGTIPAHSLTTTITVPTEIDTLVEGTEIMYVMLSAMKVGGVTAGRIADANGGGTILDDPYTSAGISIQSAASGNEGTATAGSVVFTVTLNHALGNPLTFRVSTASGTATQGTDFTGITNILYTIPAGSTTTTVTVATIPDATVESDETFTCTIQAGSLNYGYLGNAIGTGTILNDDFQPSAGLYVKVRNL